MPKTDTAPPAEEAKSIAEIWESWRLVIQAEPAGDEMEERRHAFYAGAIGMMGVCLRLDESEASAAYFQSIQRELEDFTGTLLPRLDRCEQIRSQPK